MALMKVYRIEYAVKEVAGVKTRSEILHDYKFNLSVCGHQVEPRTKSGKPTNVFELTSEQVAMLRNFNFKVVPS
jgi:hypothetical protein